MNTDTFFKLTVMIMWLNGMMNASVELEVAATRSHWQEYVLLSSSFGKVIRVADAVLESTYASG